MLSTTVSTSEITRQVASGMKTESSTKAGIDPMNKLIDRKPDDNLIAVEHG
jgi:hypothetical protein